MIALLLSAVLRFTVPSTSAGADSCAIGTTPERVMGVRLYRDGVLHATHPAIPGPDQFVVDTLAGYVYCVTAIDSAGNRGAFCAGSCLGPTVSVWDLPPAWRGVAARYDVQGRSIKRVRRGVYFEVDSVGRVKKRLKL